MSNDTIDIFTNPEIEQPEDDDDKKVLFGSHKGLTFKELLGKEEWVNSFLENFDNVLVLRKYLCENHVRVIC